MNKNAIIISISSDIGLYFAEQWLAKGWNIAGTYRTGSENLERLQTMGAALTYCDLLSKKSINEACAGLLTKMPNWDYLIFAAGELRPIGPFSQVSFSAWEKNIRINFLSNLKILQKLLVSRSQHSPCVLFFAGGGTNNATTNYSGYTISKIALIKMCELLAAEISDTRFIIVGPGWIKTKIHKATFEAGRKFAENNYERTLQKLRECSGQNLHSIYKKCTILLEKGPSCISGCNFSLVNDPIDTSELFSALEQDPNMYKLRRNKNDYFSNNICSQK